MWSSGKNRATAADGQPLLKMCGIHKSFPGVQALDHVPLLLHHGEVLALLGENGAGKSTLIKVLGGAHVPDRGELFLEGRQVQIPNPIASRQAGISVIYQEFNLVPELTVRENIFLGRERTKAGFIDSAQERSLALDLFRRIGIRVDPEARCCDLTVAQQQTVEIAKALSLKARIIVMDEPSSSLAQKEVDHLFDIIRDLKAQGIGIVYVSHRLDEVFEIADRLMVLRDGRYVDSCSVEGTSRDVLIEMMVGRSLESEFPRHRSVAGKELLRVENLSLGKSVRDVNFSLRAGEILGFAGLVGAGRTETARIVFGADKPDSGRILVKGREAVIHGPKDAIRNGICLLTEDRKGQGLILNHSVRENFGLPNLDRFVRGPFLDKRKEREEFSGYVESLQIKLSGPEQMAGDLSGGNQQKVVMAKWLARNADIIIFDEPTRGIDVGAKYEVYLLMNRLVEQGKAIIMISSELPEILGMSDRIIVMHEGRIKGEIKEVADADQESILSMAISSTEFELPG
jgi:ABC-type sugar transport system ATPase subunit